MKTRLAGPDHDRRLMFWCPGCDEAHGVRISGVQPWTWDGHRDRPTVTPSILVTGHSPERRCHSLLRQGRLEYQGDCSHEMGNQIADLPEWPTGEGWNDE